MWQVAPITMIKNEFRLRAQQTVACSTTYICYGLKLGIRILNKNTAARQLLRGHTAAVCGEEESISFVVRI
jgi:hypothetical protein